MFVFDEAIVLSVDLAKKQKMFVRETEKE